MSHFNHSVNIIVAYFDLVNLDIWVPISTPSMLGNKYFLTIIDDHDRFYGYI